MSLSDIPEDMPKYFIMDRCTVAPLFRGADDPNFISIGGARICSLSLIRRREGCRDCTIFI